jgi:penicillin-binding protein 1A
MDSGLLATDYCKNDPRGSRVTTGKFIKDDVPTQYCTIHTPVQVCVDSPILNSSGTETGMYHLAGPYCPQESIRTISVLDYLRQKVDESVVVKDDIYLKSYLELAGLCTVHTTYAPEPSDFDINDPTTWPTDDPLFDPLDPTTWPSTGSETGGEEPEPFPSVTPDVQVTDTPELKPPAAKSSNNPTQ